MRPSPTVRRGSLLAVVVLIVLAVVASVTSATGQGGNHGSRAENRDALTGWGGPAAGPDGTGRTSLTRASARRNRCGKALAKPGGGQWRCSFVDNFGGRSLDRDKWIAQNTNETGFHTGNTCFKDNRRTIQVRDGKLHLKVLKSRRSFECGVPERRFTSRYTGGMIGTRTKFSQTYGRWEVRVRFPTAKRQTGLHGGFWMYPLDQTYGPWPESGEIDVAEWWSKFPGRVIPSLHFDGRDRRHDSGRNCLVRTPTKFHTYRLLWKPTVMRFAIDGRVCFKRSWTPRLPQRAPQPFDHPFSFILHMGVGPRKGPHAVTNKTKVPAAFVVDYAKAWR